MEFIRIHSNGQWELIKSEHYQPMSAHDDPYFYDSSVAGRFFTGEEAENQSKRALGKALKYNRNSVKMLNNEHGIAEPHILLHRGLGSYKSSIAEEPNMVRISPTHIECKNDSVHTLDSKYAQAYTRDVLNNETGTLSPKKGRVFSFWVPISKFHIIGDSGKGYSHGDSPDSLFAAIKPGKFVRATPEEVDNSTL